MTSKWGFLFLTLFGATALSACKPALIGLSSGSSRIALNGFAYSPGVAAVGINTAIPTMTPSFAAGTASSWEISPALPTGLSINASTGVISGTPTTTTPSGATLVFTTYTVTATNSAGSSTYPVKLLVTPGGATNTNIVVNNTTWLNDVSPNNGICETCSIKAAIDTVSGSGVVNGRALVTINPGTYVTSAQLVIDVSNSLTDLTICGTGTDPSSTILDGNNVNRILGLYTQTVPLKLTLCNMTFQNARLTGFQTGGAIDLEPNIAGGVVTLSNVIIKNTTSSTTTTQSGGMWIGHSSGKAMTLNIDHTSFINNVAGIAGGLGLVYGITATVTDSYFSGNSATAGNGGAIVPDGNLLPTSLTVSRSTFVANTATTGGGAIGCQNTVTLSVLNSTFSQNTSTTLSGAIDIPANNITGSIAFSTFYANTATTASGGGAIYTSGAPASVSVLGNLFSDNLANGAANHCGNSVGFLTSSGYNAYSTGGGTCGTAAGTDLTSSSLNLTTTLALNGGTVLNHAINSGSSAINRVPTSTCTASTTVDTRGYTRPNGSGCSAGAYEYY